MDVTFNFDPVTIGVLATGVPVFYAVWRSVNNRLEKIEQFLVAKFGARDPEFTPGDGDG